MKGGGGGGGGGGLSKKGGNWIQFWTETDICKRSD